MSKQNKKQPEAVSNDTTDTTITDITCSAVAVAVVNREGYTLTEALELTISNGQVTAIKVLTRGPDVVAASIGKAQMALWNHYREKNEFPADKWRVEV